MTDLGLRDVGVRNAPRRLAARAGMAAAAALGMVIAVCALIALTHPGRALATVLAVGGVVSVLAAGLKLMARAGPVAVRVAPGGTSHLTWHFLASLAFSAASAVFVAGALALPIVALLGAVGVLAWRQRDVFPAALGRVRDGVAGETVLGDGIGLAPGARRASALRIVVATDRRLLVADRDGPVLDVPYAGIERFGVAWRTAGLHGELSLTAKGEAHLVRTMVPANLVSIAQALVAHGVRADDPELVADAVRGWEAARRAPVPLRERPAARTPGFDRALWLLLAVTAAILYGTRLSLPAGAVAIGLACVVSGYLSGTRLALVYLVPLNLLLAPLFFVTDVSEVLASMVALSTVAAVGLRAGALLRGRLRPAEPVVPPEAGAVRTAVGGLSLVRLSGMVLAAVVALTVTAGAAGYDLSTVRLAYQELFGHQLPVDGRSDLTQGAASITYTPRAGLHELVTDEHWTADPGDGARWELRSSFKAGDNHVSLASYVFAPRLDDAAAVADFVAGKDEEHERLAGAPVEHTRRRIDGHDAYVWEHDDRRGYWYRVVWVPAPVHSVRLECIARREVAVFKRLCAQATASLRIG